MTLEEYVLPFPLKTATELLAIKPSIIPSTVLAQRPSPIFYFQLPCNVQISAVHSGKIIEAKFTSYKDRKKMSNEELHNTNYVVIQHEDGSLLKYIHVLPSFVKEGQIVAPRQLIGVSGGSPEKYPPHLHVISTRNVDVEKYPFHPIIIRDPLIKQYKI